MADPVFRDALVPMRYLRGADVATILEKETTTALAKEMEMTMRGYIRYQLERDVRSAVFLDRLAALSSGEPVAEAQA